jgi:hypothetical protein
MRPHAQSLRFGGACTQAVGQVSISQAQIDAQVIQLQGSQLRYGTVA